MRRREHKEKPSQSRTSDAFFQPAVQKKLAVGKPGDKFEKEADSVADKVVSKTGSGDIQRAVMPGEEEKVQQKPLAESVSSVQKKDLKEEEQPVQKAAEAKEDEKGVQKKEEEPKDDAAVQQKEEEEQPVQKAAEAKEDEKGVQKKEEEPKDDAAVQQKEEEEQPVQKAAEAKEDEKGVQKKEEEPKDDAAVQQKEEDEQPVQKAAEVKEDEKAVQKKEEEQEKPLQKKEEEEKKPVQQKGEGRTASAGTEKRLSSSKGGGSPMRPELRARMESGFGTDLSNVRIHTDTNAEQMSEGMGAQAFTHGNDIYFNKGKFNPGSKEGERLIAHELTHTIQQGATSASMQPHMQKEYPWEGIIGNTWNATLRSTAGKTKPLADLPKGTPVKVTGNSGNWLRVEAFAGGFKRTGYVSQELVDLNARKISDRKSFETYPTVKESSGWMLGEKGMQSTYASNGLDLGAASLLNYDIVYLTGGLLDQIKVDPDLVKKENALIQAIKKDKRYKKEPFYLSGTNLVGFGGQRWTSSSENWGSLGSDNPLLHAETWGVAGNQLTWALRNATVKYWVDVSADGGITISYHLNDRLDLSGSPGRSEAYNVISNTLGFFYHDLANGNINMQTRAEWKVKR